MNSFLVVFVGAGIGGALRHGVNVAAQRLPGVGFLHGTITVNIVGAFALGLLTSWFALKTDPGQIWRLFLTTGVISGFTTFSTFSLEAAPLWERGQPALATFYVLSSVVLAMLGVFAGLLVMRHLT